MDARGDADVRRRAGGCLRGRARGRERGWHRILGGEQVEAGRGRDGVWIAVSRVEVRARGWAVTEKDDALLVSLQREDDRGRGV